MESFKRKEYLTIIITGVIAVVVGGYILTRDNWEQRIEVLRLFIMSAGVTGMFLFIMFAFGVCFRWLLDKIFK